MEAHSPHRVPLELYEKSVTLDVDSNPLKHVAISYRYLIPPTPSPPAQLFILLNGLQNSLPNIPQFKSIPSLRGKARFDAIENQPNSRPEDYLKELRASQRQAILDALVLLIGARVKILALPGVNDVDGQPITEQAPQVNRTICRWDALFHFEKALEQAIKIAPNLVDTVDAFNKIIAGAFAEDFLDQTAQWEFEVENKPELRNRIHRLTGNTSKR